MNDIRKREGMKASTMSLSRRERMVCSGQVEELALERGT